MVDIALLRKDLLLALEDAASPNLDRREHNATKPSELRTSDRSSLMRYLGLPLNIFGRVRRFSVLGVLSRLTSGTGCVFSALLAIATSRHAQNAIMALW